jgi:hypothetical protein
MWYCTVAATTAVVPDITSHAHLMQAEWLQHLVHTGKHLQVQQHVCWHVHMIPFNIDPQIVGPYAHAA